MKKLFHKPDEMEKNIIFKAQRNAYLFLIFALLIWSCFESFKVYLYHDTLNLIPCALLIVAAAVQGFSQFIMERNAVKDDEDSFIISPMLKIIILSCVVFSVIATAVSCLLLMGVRS